MGCLALSYYEQGLFLSTAEAVQRPALRIEIAVQRCPQRNAKSCAGSYKFGFNGQEKVNEIAGIGNHLNFGARGLDTRIGRWWSVDPLAAKYPSASPYNFALNTPIQAKDPDGRVVVFINGNHFGDGGSPSYWRQYKTEYIQLRAPSQWYDPGYGKWEKKETYAFDKNIMRAVGDNKAIYRDGSMGGWAPFRNSNMNGDAEMRRRFGMAQALVDANGVIANLNRDADGRINETIKIISHSMGSAYAKGYAAGLLEYAKSNKIEGVRIEFEADFSPYQPSNQKAVRGSGMGKTYQFSHSKDVVAGDEPIEGAIQMDTKGDPGQGHSIFDYKGQEKIVGENARKDAK